MADPWAGGLEPTGRVRFKEMLSERRELLLERFAAVGEGAVIRPPFHYGDQLPLSLASNRPRLETLSSLSGTGSSNPSPSSSESRANLAAAAISWYVLPLARAKT
jgi:hypothetical protein